MAWSAKKLKASHQFAPARSVPKLSTSTPETLPLQRLPPPPPPTLSGRPIPRPTRRIHIISIQTRTIPTTSTTTPRTGTSIRHHMRMPILTFTATAHRRRPHRPSRSRQPSCLRRTRSAATPLATLRVRPREVTCPPSATATTTSTSPTRTTTRRPK